MIKVGKGTGSENGNRSSTGGRTVDSGAIKLGGLPQDYSMTKEPSEWMKEEGSTLEDDVKE